VTFRNVYVYSPLKLWLAYGLALFFATGAVFTGFALMYKNQASYSNNFSTVLRTTRNAQISADFSKRDYSGVDPLSSRIANSVVVFDSEVENVEASIELLAMDERVEELVEGELIQTRSVTSRPSRSTDSEMEMEMQATHESPARHLDI
jgi:hypothetical protein